MSSALAAELASGIYDNSEVFSRFGISVERAAVLLKTPGFQDMVKSAKRDWEDLGNVKSRVRVKARLALEEALPAVYGIVMDSTQPPVARVAAFKEIKDLSSVAQLPQEIQAGSGLPVVTIMLGDSGRDVTVEGTAVATEVEAPASIPGLDVLAGRKPIKKRKK